MDLAIDVKHLSKNFNGKPAVIDVALQVQRGEVFGFLGPNGSGKTTTIRMLCGLLTPDSGEGQCLGYDILTQSSQIKLHVGYMTQKFSLYEDLTVYENLEFIGRIYQVKNRKQQIEETLNELEFGARKNQLAGSLSGGWKQRLALAAALLHKPQLLLLDEPTAGVDPQARRDFWDHIHRLAARGITALVSTHYMDEVERCNRIAYIAHGHLLVHGTVEEVIKEIKLTTWLVKGQHLAELAERLEKIPDIEQVSVFGNTLHVSSSNAEALLIAITPFFSDTNYHWSQIDSSMEDVFISLIAHSKEERYG